MIKKLKERFKFIDEEDVWPYLENVLNRIPDKERAELLNDKNIEIINIKKGVRGFQIPFRNPVDSLIFFNWVEISDLSALAKRYGVAHEIAHHFAGTGMTGLREKEADDLLRKWGFEKEIEAAGYSAPCFENKGYNIGYEESKKNLLPSESWFGILCYSIKDWENEGLTLDQKKNLLRYIDDTSIAAKLYEEPDNRNLSDDNRESLLNGIRCGIMFRVKELEKQK